MCNHTRTFAKIFQGVCMGGYPTYPPLTRCWSVGSVVSCLFPHTAMLASENCWRYVTHLLTALTFSCKWLCARATPGHANETLCRSLWGAKWCLPGVAALRRLCCQFLICRVGHTKTCRLPVFPFFKFPDFPFYIKCCSGFPHARGG